MVLSVEDLCYQMVIEAFHNMSSFLCLKYIFAANLRKKMAVPVYHVTKTQGLCIINLTCYEELEISTAELCSLNGMAGYCLTSLQHQNIICSNCFHDSKCSQARVIICMLTRIKENSETVLCYVTAEAFELIQN